MQPTQSLSLKVVEKIAEREGIEPDELHPPIHDAINTDALDSLYQASDPERNPSKVEFAYSGYTVTADSTGEVNLEKRITASDPDKTTV